MRRLLLALMLALGLAMPARAALTEAELAEAGLNPPAGAALPLDLPLRDETGRPATPADVLGGRPAVLVLADYTCETLCGTALGLAASALVETGLRPGVDYSFLVLGIDARDGPEQAAAMKATYLGSFPEVMRAARFLTGPKAVLDRAQAAIGYRAEPDLASDRYAHPLAAIVLTPAGTLSRVLPGLALEPVALAGAMRDAASAGGGGLVEIGVRLLCYGLDPARGIYNAVVKRGLAMGTAATAILLGIAALLLARRGRRA
ncbi:SCO family protein [Pararoseomonas indoligenes]|uniref:SCO family protein n=1 Tax=Roseomonas indoligenes TaxID=2820811 RepID=A0A940S5Z6_9PROT|nr:SCO family protein [Pararoseomonas indoligenes]MBP0491413.1 SCO family protein [Pararoseomonas indoligenes]